MIDFWNDQIETFKLYCKDLIAEYPELRDQIQDIFYLAMEEIEDGGSVTHEIQLAMDDIDNILADF